MSRVVPKLIVATVDQAVYAGTNMCLALLLAYSEGLETLGRYALVYSVAAVGHALLAGSVLDPMTTFGAKPSAGRARLAYGQLVGVGSLAVLAIAICAALLGKFAQSDVLSAIAAGLALFAAQAQLLGYKRYLYVRGRVDAALVASVRYAMIALIGAVSLSAAGRYSEYSLVVCACVGAVLSSTPFILRVMRAKQSHRFLLTRVGGLSRYTRWALMTSLPSATATQAIYWIAGMGGSIGAVGQLKLYEQMMLPIAQALSAVVLLDQVKSAARFSDGRCATAFAYCEKRAWVYAFVASGYVALAVMLVKLASASGVTTHGIYAVSLATYGCGTVAYCTASAKNIALRMSRRPEFVGLSFALVTIYLCIGPLWSEGTLDAFVVLVASGWWLHLIILSAATAFVRRGIAGRASARAESRS